MKNVTVTYTCDRCGREIVDRAIWRSGTEPPTEKRDMAHVTWQVEFGKDLCPPCIANLLYNAATAVTDA